MNTQSNYADDPLVRLPEVMRHTGLGRSTIYELMQTGRFPRATKLTARAVAWHMGELRAWKADPVGWRGASPVTSEGNNAGQKAA